MRTSPRLPEKESEILRIHDAPADPDPYAMILTNAQGVSKQIAFEKPDVQANNAILDELTFAQSTENDSIPPVTLEQGAAALKVALEIVRDIERHAERAKAARQNTPER